MKKLIAAFMLSLPLWTGCRNSGPDISKVQVEVTAYDFYKDFSRLDTAHLEAGLETLRAKYPQYLPFYLDTLAAGTVSLADSSTNAEGIKTFLTHKDYKHLLDTVNQAFPSTDDITESLTTTFRYIKYYDTGIALPDKIYYAVSGLSNMVGLGSNNTLTICLDYFLGENFNPYYQINIPEYVIPRFKKAYAPVMAAQVLYQDAYPFEPHDKDLLTMMIEQGKMQYFLGLVTPQVQEHMHFGFTQQQLEWCRAHERDIYNFFTSNDFLFSKNMQQVMRFVSDGPFTMGMPQESPGNIGSFTGYRIVQQYVKETGADWYALVSETDAQKILKLSKYRP